MTSTLSQFTLPLGSYQIGGAERNMLLCPIYCNVSGRHLDLTFYNFGEILEKFWLNFGEILEKFGNFQ